MRFATYDLQETFDLAVHYFQETPKRCARPLDGFCSYLLPDTGERCVAGYMMVAETHDQLRAMVQIKGGVRVAAKILGMETEETHLVLLEKLQTAHDTQTNWDALGFTNWSALLDIALTFDLRSDTLVTALEGVE